MAQDISGIKHPAFQSALALLKPAARQETGNYLAEGADLVMQALRSPSEVRSVFATTEDAALLQADCAARDIPLHRVGTGLIHKLVGTGYETAVGAVAVVGQRRILPEDVSLAPDALLLAGERIQDPRNVGVLIRTAEAAGCALLLLSADSAEPFSRAAVRSTTGSIFRLPVCIAPDLPALLTRLRALGVSVMATSAKAPYLAYDAPLHVRPLTLVVGNETEGISAATREAASGFVALPMIPGGASSLNVTVAAGALLYEAVRQRLQNGSGDKNVPD